MKSLIVWCVLWVIYKDRTRTTLVGTSELKWDTTRNQGSMR